MYKSVLLLLSVIASHVHPSSQLQDESYQLRLEISGPDLLRLVTDHGERHVMGRIEEIFDKRLNRHHSVSIQNKMARGKDSFKGDVLEMVLRITAGGDHSSSITDIIGDTINTIKKRFNFHINYNLWAIAPRTVQLERCLALLEEDCSVEGSGCQPVHTSSSSKPIKNALVDRMLNDGGGGQLYVEPAEWTTASTLAEAITSTASPTIPVSSTIKAVNRVPTKTIRHVLELNTTLATDCLNGKWYRQLKHLQNSSHVYQNGTLVLRTLSVHDSGAYYCKVDGQKVLNLIITVLDKPIVMSVTSDISFPATKSVFMQRVGLALTFYCNIDPSNAGEVVWGRSDKRLFRKGVQQLDNALRFDKLSCADAGKYTCTLLPVSTHLPQVKETITLKPFELNKFCSAR